MNMILIGSLSILFLLVFFATNIPIANVFLIVGFISSLLLIKFSPSISLLGQSMYFTISSPIYVTLPLFVLMGSLAARAGFAKKAYDGLHIASSGLPGSLAVATCYACAAFGTISGSSLSTAVVFGRLAIPEMKRQHYNVAFSAGTIAAAGTFASMIPPSALFIIYALFAEESVAKLFAAGVFPGLITATVYSISIIYRCSRNPKLVKMVQEKKNVKLEERILALGKIWPIFFVASIVLGGIYTGIFTPTEAAAVGCVAILVLGWMTGGDICHLNVLRDALRESASTNAMVFIIMIGAMYYSRFLALSRLPILITEIIVGAELPGIYILLGLLIIMFFLGMIIVPVGIFALVLPIALPVIKNLGYDPIWFGVICLKLTEIASVTPPVGLNIFAIKGVAGKDVPIEEIYNGIWPYVLCDLIVLGFLIAYPQISLWLPNLLYR